VRAEREEPSTIHIPRSETQFVPGAFGDPFKIVEALPGMAPWLSGLPYVPGQGVTVAYQSPIILPSIGLEAGF
jgi:hypothetical protein